MIWKIWKKSKLKCEMICKVLNKGKLNNEMIWKIWKIYVLVIITPKENSSSSLTPSPPAAAAAIALKSRRLCNDTDKDVTKIYCQNFDQQMIFFSVYQS